METRVSYTIVGFFVTVLAIAGIIFFLWLSSFRAGKTYNTYLVYVHENVTGLSVQSPVRYNGVPVGYVKAIDLDKKNPQLVKLTLSIETGTPITESTVATLLFQGITAVLYVGLKETSANSPLLLPRKEEPFPVIPSRPSFITQISEVIPDIMKEMKKIADSIGQVLDKKNQKSIRETFQNLSEFSKMLSNNTKTLDTSIQSLKITLQNTAKASSALPQTLEKLNDALTAVKQTAQNVNTSAQSFSTQIVPTTQRVLNQLNRITSNLQQVTSEMERNPSILVRGKQAPPPGPGER